MTSDIDNLIARYAHAPADNGLRVRIAIHSDDACGTDITRVGGINITTVEIDAAHGLTKAIDVEQTGGIDGDAGVIGKLAASKRAHHIGIRGQFVFAAPDMAAPFTTAESLASSNVPSRTVVEPVYVFAFVPPSVTEPVLILVNPPLPEMAPLNKNVPELAINVFVLRRISPVQIDAPLALKAPPGLSELMVRFSLVIWTLLRTRLALPFTKVPAGPKRLAVAPRERSDRMASCPSFTSVLPL
jgi:hypothetical protein